MELNYRCFALIGPVNPEILLMWVSCFSTGNWILARIFFKKQKIRNHLHHYSYLFNRISGKCYLWPRSTARLGSLHDRKVNQAGVLKSCYSSHLWFVPILVMETKVVQVRGKIFNSYVKIKFKCIMSGQLHSDGIYFSDVVRFM